MTTTDLQSRLQMLWGLRNSSENVGDFQSWKADFAECDRAVNSIVAFLSAPLRICNLCGSAIHAGSVRYAPGFLAHSACIDQHWQERASR